MVNRLRTDVGLFRSETHKWCIASTVACECGAKKHTAEHVITSCPIYHHSNGARCFIRCQQEPGYLADENMSGHLVHLQLPSIYPKQRTLMHIFLYFFD